MILIIDNFDSFTYNLVDYFEQLGHDCRVVRNDCSLEEIERLDFDLLVLSPGPGKPEDAGILMQVIKKYHQRIPILGICLGHQALGVFFGAELKHAQKPMHGKLSLIEHEKEGLFHSMPSPLEVTRYHSLVLKNLPECLKILAKTSDEEIMAFQHKKLPISGIQFHPEAVLTQYGKEMLADWIQLVQPKN
ncbi:MAG: aminodeoxychorismate/anthranilate synthase component II [Cytophagales bacterium]|nr:aminodeoxychorismate/anthranilate synthase component II [Cytophagales bacterium]